MVVRPNSLVHRNLDLSIESDSFLTGWETSCQEVQTRGPWSNEDKNYHITCLELLAATVSVKMFVKGQLNKRILLLLDNRTAGRDSLYTGNANDLKPVEVVPKERYLTVSSAPCRGEKRYSGHRVQSDERSLWLDVESVGVSPDSILLPISQLQPVSISTHYLASLVLQLETGPLSRRGISGMLTFAEILGNMGCLTSAALQPRYGWSCTLQSIILADSHVAGCDLSIKVRWLVKTGPCRFQGVIF